MIKRLLAILTLTTLCALSLSAADELERGFTHPPDSARPWVYWFWLSGNITSNGITADLEAMKRVGIGGVLIMETDQGAPVGPADFMGPKWRDLFKHVASEARRLGLEVNLNNDAGWNGSGGPWIKPEQSMQKVVWAETNLAGPKRFERTLAQPETVAGFYKDITVLAFPTTGAHRIAGIRQKALFETGFVDVPAGQSLPAEMLIDRSRVLDLTKSMDRDGRLQWDVPEGQWTVLRLGHTSTGVENAPAPKTGRGLECDKLSKEGIEANFAGMMAKVVGDTTVKGGRANAGLVATHIDSWENGAQNWTAKMREEFQKRRGYNLLPFTPVITGRVVESAEVSERFLWDLRQTISELVVENYAGHMRDLARAAGLRFTVEAYGCPCDSIPYGGASDEPMGEFWSPSGAMETCRGMASSGHVYGKRIIGAESFTAADQEKWQEHPGSLKALGDVAFCEGINRFVFHRYALQPWAEDRRPGMMMGPWGQHYERTETWWEQTPEWHRYLARCQFLLRQGMFVADICYLQPERPPQGFEAHPHRGYDYDECGAEVVLNRMSVKDGWITLPDGMSYRLLVLPQTGQMTPPLLRKIKELAQAGATIVGPPPQKSPSLSGFPGCDREVQELAGEIWGAGDASQTTARRLGSGRVFRQREPEKILTDMGVAPDFTSSEPLRYIHRRADGVDIYFVANHAPRSVSTTGAFRVAGKVPELWWPDTGKLEQAAVFQEGNGRTGVGLTLGPSGSVFVIFRKPLTSTVAATRLLHDGELVVSGQLGSQLPVRIERATYGVLGNPDKTRDVRQKVQQKVDAGERSFQVLSLAAGDDPAPEVVKTLVVDYVIGGNHYTVKGQDSATVHLTGDGVGLVVEKARYGVLDDPKRTRDVRDKLQRLVDAGESSFPVARMAEGDDPAFMVVKTLEVEYTLDGKRMSAHGTDPELIELRPLAAERALVAELHATDGRKLELAAFKPGKYEVEFGDGTRRDFNAADIPEAQEISGPWSVRFAPAWGGPAQATFEKLVSWSSHPDPGIKYYSGTAVYSAAFELPRTLLKRDRRLYLDLGRVEIMAEVKVNGKGFPLLWKPPYRLDVTEAARAGQNTLEVTVVNLWPNRLIGDEQLPEDSERNPNGTLKRWPQWLLDGKPSPTGRYTFSMWRLWKKNDALLDSGLLGPVKLIPAQEFQTSSP
ncbi:MAG: glycosyl hydrolase [Limisphaerales bacterium]